MRLASSWWRRKVKFADVPHGDALGELAPWLGDACGSGRGVWYMYVTSVSQMGLSALTGGLYALPWAQSEFGGQACHRPSNAIIGCMPLHCMSL